MFCSVISDSRFRPEIFPLDSAQVTGWDIPAALFLLDVLRSPCFISAIMAEGSRPVLTVYISPFIHPYLKTVDTTVDLRGKAPSPAWSPRFERAAPHNHNSIFPLAASMLLILKLI